VKGIVSILKAERSREIAFAIWENPICYQLNNHLILSILVSQVSKAETDQVFP